MNCFRSYIEEINSNEIKSVVSALHKVNQLTFESSALSSNELGSLIISIFCLLDAINPMSMNIGSPGNFNEDVISYDILTCSQNENLLLILALNIIRNLSQESNNEYLISSCPNMLKHLVSIIQYANLTDNIKGNNEILSISFEILSNVINRVDFHFGSRFKSSFDTFDTQKGKEDIQLMISPYFSTVSTEYSSLYNSLFQSLYHSVMKPSSNRIFLLRCLELLIKIATIVENISLFLPFPTAFSDRLVQLFESSHSYTPCVGNFHVELIDPDCRDLCVELIHLLCIGSNRLQTRFAQNPKLLKIICLSIKSCRVERSAYRNSESTLRMISIFNFLTSKKEGIINGFQNDLVLESFHDPDFLDFCLNSNLNHDFIAVFSQKTNISPELPT